MKLSEVQRETLKAHEKRLRKLCSMGHLDDAELSLKHIQSAFREERGHHRLLRSKLVYFEALLDDGKTEEAEDGLKSIRLKANKGTRLHVEARASLAICALRKNDLETAKGHIQYVLKNYGAISSERKRTQFHERLQQRIEDECFLSQFISARFSTPKIQDIEKRVVELVTKNDDEIFAALATKIAPSSLLAANDVKLFVLKQLTPEEKLLLPPPPAQQSTTSLGKKAFKALRRVAWKVLCDKNKGTYHIWTNGLAAVFGGMEFLKSVSNAFQSWHIGDIELISAFTASAIKSGCAVFCEELKPDSLIIPQSE